MQDTFGLREESAFRAATGLHGGMGKGDVCGSLMGANLMMGLVFGDDVKDAEKSKEDFKPGVLDTPTRLVGEIYDWFGKEFTSVKCQDIRDKHEKEVDAEPDAKGLTEEERLDRMISRCEELCCKTAARAAEIIFDEMDKG